MDLHERSVSRDVRELGDRLGEILEEQTDCEAFEDVETVRTAAIEAREEGEVDCDTVADVLGDGVDEVTSRTLARAFTTYFELVNVAEERERVRTLREDGQAGCLTDDVATAVERLADRGVDAAEMGAILDDIFVVPTFTAHPTEARRKTVKGILRRVAEDLRDLDERRLTDEERAERNAHVDALVETLWTTEQVRERRPEPFDEARNVQWYLENTLFDVIPEVYDALRTALEEQYDDPPAVPELLSFRSWAGSDRDGNPFVTPAVTSRTLSRQRDLVVDCYDDALGRLEGVLGQSVTSLDTTTIERSLDADRRSVPALVEMVRERYPGEPFRQKVAVVRDRVDRVNETRDGGYDDADELVADLDDVVDGLRDNGLEDVVAEYLRPLRRQVQTFGFHFASLDLRDHRKMHTDAIALALDGVGVDYAGMSEDERVAFLTDAILADDATLDLETAAERVEDDDARRVLERFRSLADWHDEFGAEAVDTYCISMTEAPSHVLEVLFLASSSGVVDLPDDAAIDVVPLLETEHALSNTEEILGTLFENEAYAQSLAARGNGQEVMLGYSDSAKENGYFAAQWAIHATQRELARITDDYDVDLRFFHGRGGSISRGGGPMNEKLLALPRSTVTGETKFTQQGESIAENYANERIAARNLEQMLDARIRARYRARDDARSAVRDEWREAIDRMSSLARESYRDLLDSEGFTAFYEQMTPIGVIEDLNLGSRPASRSGERTVEDLRTIPWVFSWTQTRAIVSGWYGLGTGIDAYLESGGDVELLREMYAEWPFFRTTVDNAANALARTELDVASEYADLVDPDLRKRFFPRIVDEYETSVARVLEVTGRDALLDSEWLSESLDRRNPYVDPLNALQVALLDQTDRSEALERTLRLTVKGIAAGMKTTG
ncbi:MAG: phosphoenolpyruvate carboxylase [Haloplanus sp.]